MDKQDKITDFLLIRPSYYDTENRKLDLTTSLILMPPVGLGYVAAACREEFNVRIIDMEAERIKINDLWRHIESFSPKVIGITVMSSTLEQTKEIIRTIKEKRNIPIIIGGPHAILDPVSIFEIDNVDYIVCGEAEVMINDLLDFLIYKKGEIDKIKNLVYKTNGKIHFKEKELIKNLDCIPFPRRELWEKDNYFHFFARGKPCTSIITSRGCPYTCVYCTPIYRSIRRRSIGNVIQEIKEIIDRFSIRDLEFFDETFNLNEAWVIEFCQELLKERLLISWRARCRPDLITEEAIKWMKRAGCYMISLGIESANNNTLKFFNKNYVVSQIKEAIKIIKKYGIELHAYFIIGSPTETKKETWHTIYFAIKENLDYAIFSLLTPQPGTKLMEISLRNKWLSKEDFDYNKIKGYCIPVLKHPQLSPKEILKIYKMATMLFFARPKRIFNLSKRIIFNRGTKRSIIIKTILNYLF